MQTGVPEVEPEIGVIVVTHRARVHLERCLRPILASRLRPRVLVVNSSSRDGTVELAEELGAETMVVPRERFNHGLTREEARLRLNLPVTVFMTPDAYPDGSEFLERLVAPIVSGQAEIAYGRQVAREDAEFVERVARDFNYPGCSHVRAGSDWADFGSYTHFCSNACAAWWGPALDAIGGFRSGLVSEETVATAEILRRGGRIAYVAEAVVEHSHRLSLSNLFRRQFDIGYARNHARELLLDRESDSVRGRQFVQVLLRRARREAPAGVPRVLMQIAAMWAGYRCGRIGPMLPTSLAARLSGQDYYWSPNGSGDAGPNLAGV